MKFLLKPEDYLILVVDDTEANVRLLSHVLRTQGFKVVVAFNGEDALDITQIRRPDLILLDIMMPDMTGYEVCRRINRDIDLKDIPIIFLSALSETSDKVEGFEAGGVDYVTKPFQKDEVLARIRTHLVLAELQKERESRIETLRIRESELKELNKRKDNLIRMVSHDIKNPLTGIVGLTNMLQTVTDIGHEKEMEILAVMESSGRKLLDLVEHMLDAEQKDESADQFVFSQFSVEELLDKIISVNNPKALLKKVELHSSVETQQEEYVFDSIKMEIALNNLVSNALKFTPENGQVIIKAWSDGDVLLFSVTDTGIGINNTMQDSLLKVREGEINVSEPGTEGEKGTGLGLNLVKNYINLHKGEIWFESEMGKGTTFYIRIPKLEPSV